MSISPLDGPGSAPLFVALQVPLFHKALDGQPIFVFADIKIIGNSVGLLDGKEYL